VKGALEYVFSDAIIVFERGHLMGEDYSRTAGLLSHFLLRMVQGTFFGQTLVSRVMNT
jgi:hypothetical protein